jgi:tRNA threonylcarbamoyladenosine biosynthesis protein TsaE
VATRIVETSDSRQTEALGAELAAALTPGDIVLVRGELGAGKTTLVRGAARALGVAGPVTSPTFSIGHRYQGTDVTVSHLDLYRLAGLHEEEPALLEDYLGAGRIAFVEWPEETSVELRDARVLVTLTHLGADRRRIEVHESDKRIDATQAQVEDVQAQADDTQAQADDMQARVDAAQATSLGAG